MNNNKFYQFLFDYGMGVKKSIFPKFRGFSYKLYMELVKNQRKNKINNVFIYYSLNGKSIIINTTHVLPFTLRDLKLYSTNLVRLSNYINEIKKSVKIIDIGANIGDSVFLIKQFYDYPILCVEGNEEYLDMLKYNISKYNNVSLEECFVGSEDCELNGRILSDGYGSSTIKIDINSINSDIKYKSLKTILDKNLDFSDFNLLKIDTDGYDCEIIRGNLDLIVKLKPTIFFEYAPFFLKNGIHSELTFFKTLSENNYDKLIFYNNKGEFLCECDSKDEIAINNAHQNILKRKEYGDIIAFHSDDKELFEYVLKSEYSFMLNHFEKR